MCTRAVYAHTYSVTRTTSPNPFRFDSNVTKSLIDKKSFVVDDIGMSGNQVLIFEDMVLKIEDSSVSMIDNRCSLNL